MTTETVKLNYLHIAPRKVRLIANTMKGLTVNEAEAQLMMRPQRASKPLLKLLRSAVANAKHNKKLDEQRLIVDSIRVDQGPIMKRFMPRAMGRATPIHKKSSHITLVLKEVDKTSVSRFNVPAGKVKPAKKEKKFKKQTVKPEMQREGKTKEKAGFFKKFFQRKSV